MNITDTSLFRQQCYINGSWVDAADGATITVTNPATGERVGSVPKLSQRETAAAINAAQAALGLWQALTPMQRGRYLHQWQRLIEEHVDDLAMILTVEEGKPLAEAKGEILLNCGYLSWFAEEARRAYGDVLPPPAPGVRTMTSRRGVGVAAAITPWNFPFGMIPRKAAPALAAGCPIIIKPASATPFSALALAELAHRAGLPAGTVAVVTGEASVVGGEIAANPLVRKLSFTGSTAVGKTLSAQCAATMKHVSMELGGNAPFIVFPDADLELAAKAALHAKFRNAGQTCVAADRFLVHQDVHDAFVRRLAELVGAIRLGNGTDPAATMGPLINEAAKQNMLRLLADACGKGAIVVTGGKPATLGGKPSPTDGLFFEPTVLSSVTPDMAVWHEEVFGPIAAVMPFTSEAQALALANDTEYGLAAYMFTRDFATAIRVSESLAFGMVGVNETVMARPEMPFGGTGASGLGREGGHEGLDAYLETHFVTFSLPGL